MHSALRRFSLLAAALVFLAACGSQPGVALPASAPTIPAAPALSPSALPPTVAPATAAPAATAEPAPTEQPVPTEAPIPPTGKVVKRGEAYSAPESDATVLGILCPSDRINFLSRVVIGTVTWHRIQITQQDEACDPKSLGIGTTAWTSTQLSAPSYPLEAYAQMLQVALPTDTPPTATLVRGRVGIRCKDGTVFLEPRRSLCEPHGGMDIWLYNR